MTLGGCAGQSQSGLATATIERSVMPPPPPRPEETVIRVEDYAQPFGHAPVRGDVKQVFLALPDPLAGDTTVEARRQYLEYLVDIKDSSRYDRKGRFVGFWTDNPYMFYHASLKYGIKVFPSRRYSYVVLIHLEDDPDPGHGFILAPQKGQWVDVTAELLPKEVPRQWYFNISRLHDVVQTGPYKKWPAGGWVARDRVYDLVWDGDRFQLKRAASKKYTYDFMELMNLANDGAAAR